MPRPEKNRKICRPPLMKGFKPFGIPLCKIEKIKFTFEEYESIRLVVYNNLHQEKAAEQMNVSRPTLTRIYNKALTNIAKAFVEGKALEFDGGNYELDEDWYRCKKCHNLTENPKNQIECETCNDNNENQLVNLNNRALSNLNHKGSEGLGPKTGKKRGPRRKTEAKNKEIIESSNQKLKRCRDGSGKGKRLQNNKINNIIS
jgi:predicted DNA-binding protein (UPF0251 family)